MGDQWKAQKACIKRPHGTLIYIHFGQVHGTRFVYCPDARILYSNLCNSTAAWVLDAPPCSLKKATIQQDFISFSALKSCFCLVNEFMASNFLCIRLPHYYLCQRTFQVTSVNSTKHFFVCRICLFPIETSFHYSFIPCTEYIHYQWFSLYHVCHTIICVNAHFKSHQLILPNISLYVE